MFKKLLSNLPFNPSLIGQVSFYAKRVRHEQSVRRLGFMCLILALIVQIFAVISPPEPTLAESNNDIIRGGFGSREQAVNYCRTNAQDFAHILAYFKVSCDLLAIASTVTIRSTDHDKQFLSMGRIAQGPTIARTGKPTDEHSVMINGTQYFVRNLWAWDTGAYSTYQALQVKNSDGVVIKLLFLCGNIVTVGRYTPPPSPPPKIPTPPKEQPKDVCSNIEGVQTKETDCDVCPNIPQIQTAPDQCYPCPSAQANNIASACLEFNKTASNQTQKITSAGGTVARAGDVIVYTLSAKNKGTVAVKGFIMDENLSDVLEYADIVDLQGGTLDTSNHVVWDKADIAAAATLQKTITVKVKDPIPQTPVSASDPTSFDLVMNNVFYGTAVNIKLPAGVTKSTEVLVQTLPNTGPGTTILLGFIVTAAAAYFFARSRLLTQELDLVRTDFTSTGGA